MTERDFALSLVRAARRQLESLRLLRGAARGALVGAALGLVLLLLDKTSGGGAVTAALAWTLTLGAALVATLATWLRPAVPATSAALYLDRRCATEERFVTLWSLPDDPHASDWAADVARVTRVPRVALPREAALVPLAFFLLFGAGLLPSAGATAPAPVAGVTEAAAEAAPAPEADQPADTGKQADEAARKLRKRVAPDTETLDAIERLIDDAFVRPEDRSVARAELAKARAGDSAAKERLAKALVEGAGALGEPEADPAASVVRSPEKSAGIAASSPYPEEAAFLRAYDVALARLTSRGKG